jgi:hypothetical protein
MRTAIYVLTRDLVIPAGTVIDTPPIQSTRWGSDFEAIIGVGRDHSGYFSMDIDEALDSGLVIKAASVGRSGNRQDRADGLGPKDEHAVGEAETPTTGQSSSSHSIEVE